MKNTRLKKMLFTALLSGICLVHGYAQTHSVDDDTSTTPATTGQMEELADAMKSSIDMKTADLSDSIKALNKSLDTLKNAMSYSDYYDSATIAFLQKDASSLYNKCACDSAGSVKKGCTGYAKVCKVSGWLLFLAVLVAGMVLFAQSAICKDESYDANNKLRPLKERPYSYAKVQLFWWTMIILCCYIAFFAMHCVLVPLNMTTIVLLGLGAAVFAGGRIIDNRQKDSVPTGKRIQDESARGDSFFTDILSDENGISIHRFQSLVFNLVFGIAFIYFFVTAVCCHKYPFIDFNEWQFALLGISSATYLGIKATENKAPNDNNPADKVSKQ